ncbi:MAG: hypothetical protein KDA37_04075 [Planctomycetales bacterium]|nr:hypothetical protein [Planctomycetales bacterium]
MSWVLRNLQLSLTALALSVSATTATAQTEYVFQPTEGVHDWNTPENWLGNGALVFVPDADIVAGESAYLNTDAKAQVSNSTTPRVSQLNVNRGTVLVDSSGKLETFVSAGSSGALILVSDNSRLEVRDNGQVEVGTVLSSIGDLHLYGPNASVDVAGDLLLSGSVIGAHISDTTHGQITAGGSADLSGTLLVDVSGVSPVLGMTWNLVTASGGIAKMFDQIVVDNTPPLTRGLQFQAVENGNTAQLKVGNTLIVTVDRQTGDTTIENPIGSGINVASYALRSAAGSLSPGTAQSLNDSGVAGTGWLGSPATANLLSEVKPSSTFTLGAGQSVSLGNAYATGVTPSNEDIMLDFTTTTGEVYQGIVEYSGFLNDLVLFVDPADGSAAIGNLSSAITPSDLTSYAVTSAGGQLVPGNWDTLETSGEAGSGWDATPGSTAFLAETNLTDAHLFSYGTLIDLGQIFTPSGLEDLQFIYTVDGVTTQIAGSVVYGAIPMPPVGLPGDFNGDAVVDAADYTVWRDNLGAPDESSLGGNGSGGGGIGQEDYDLWQSNYGATALSGASTYAAAPEPTASVLTALLFAAATAFRRRQSCSDV